MDKLKFFILGIIAAFGALFLELIFFSFLDLEWENWKTSLSSLSGPIIFSVFLEECVKFSVILKIFSQDPSKTYFRKAIIQNSFFLGLGFASTEITFIFFQFFPSGNFQILDLIGVFFIHTTTTGILSLTQDPNFLTGIKKYLVFFSAAFLIHLIYNALVIYQPGKSLVFTFLFFTFLLLLGLFFLSQKKQEEENLQNF